MKLGRWELQPDLVATRAAYANLGAYDCDCDPCQNFAAQAASAFPTELLTVFEGLGIDWRKPVERYHDCRLSTGLHPYGGWYLLNGVLVSGADSHKQAAEAGRTWTIEFERQASIGFSQRVEELGVDAFSDGPVLQLDFQLELPWVIDKDEPY